MNPNLAQFLKMGNIIGLLMYSRHIVAAAMEALRYIFSSFVLGVPVVDDISLRHFIGVE